MAFVGGRQCGWFKELLDAGLVPAETCRIVVDISLDDCVRVYYETYASEKMLDVSLLARGDIAIIGPREIRVSVRPPKPPPAPPPPPPNENAY